MKVKVKGGVWEQWNFSTLCVFTLSYQEMEEKYEPLFFCFFLHVTFPPAPHFHSWVLRVWPDAEAAGAAAGQPAAGDPDWLKAVGAETPPLTAMSDICWVT